MKIILPNEFEPKLWLPRQLLPPLLLQAHLIFFSSLLFSIHPSLSFSMVSSVASFLTNLQSHNHFVLQGHAMDLVKKNRGGGLFWPAPLREEMSWFLSYCIYTSPLITLGLSNIFRLTSRIIFIIHNYSFNVS